MKIITIILALIVGVMGFYVYDLTTRIDKIEMQSVQNTQNIKVIVEFINNTIKQK